jgi:hypothetical protein
LDTTTSTLTVFADPSDMDYSSTGSTPPSTCGLSQLDTNSPLRKVSKAKRGPATPPSLAYDEPTNPSTHTVVSTAPVGEKLPKHVTFTDPLEYYCDHLPEELPRLSDVVFHFLCSFFSTAKALEVALPDLVETFPTLREEFPFHNRGNMTANELEEHRQMVEEKLLLDLEDWPELSQAVAGQPTSLLLVAVQLGRFSLAHKLIEAGADPHGFVKAEVGHEGRSSRLS